MCVCWDGRRVGVSVAMTTGVVTSLIHGNIIMSQSYSEI